MVPKVIIWNRLGGPGGEIVQNGTKSDHLDRLGSPGGEMVQNGTKSDHLDLNDPSRAECPNKGRGTQIIKK